MKEINVLYWNVQNFGSQTAFKDQYQPLCRLMAWIAHTTEADVILLQEVKRVVLANPSALTLLHTELNNLPEPANNWYCDVIKGSVAITGAPVAPYATAADLDWDAGHDEGYAMFWNQNIAKFLVTRAPPVGGVENTQSETVRIAPGPPVPFPANAGLQAPPGVQYTLPAGTQFPDAAPIIAPQQKAGGEVLTNNTIIGPGGVRLAAPPPGFNPVLIPGGYELTEPLLLPAAGTFLIPAHALALVLKGRDTRGGGLEPSTFTGSVPATPFAPGEGAAQMQDVWFTRGAGFPAACRGPRRPAYATLNLNAQGPAVTTAERLLPLIVYHAPAAAPASSSGMQRAAYSQPLYQAYDWGTGNWIDNDRAILGGDFNATTDKPQYAYGAFMRPIALGGAACEARAYAPPPPRARVLQNMTTVQLYNPARRRKPRTPIIAPGLAAYRRLAIDNIFYRGFAPAQAPPPAPATNVVDLLSAVSAAGGPQVPAPVTQSFSGNPDLLHCLWVMMGLLPPPAPALPDVQSWEDLVADIWAGNFAGPPIGATPSARTAAEFVNKCVSDHLPVVFEMRL